MTIETAILKNVEKLLEYVKKAVLDFISEAGEINEDDQPKEEIIKDFRQAWHEAMTGQTIPVAQLWQRIEEFTPRNPPD